MRHVRAAGAAGLAEIAAIGRSCRGGRKSGAESRLLQEVALTAAVRLSATASIPRASHRRGRKRRDAANTQISE
jgi:hypothetical protein